MLVKRICKQCNKEFEVHDFDVRRGRGKFCSQKCWHEYKTGKTRNDYRKPKLKKCIICGEEFLVGGRCGKRKKQIFCSWNCSRLARYRHGSQCNKLNKVDCAYIAGFIDGEGSIIIYERKSGWSGSFAMRVSIAQSKKGIAILEWIKDITGIGSIITHKRFNPLHATSCQWQVNSEAAETLLKQILPYLILKKVQAELALDFQSRLREPELKADRKWQINFRQTMQTLNMRGCVAET